MDKLLLEQLRNVNGMHCEIPMLSGKIRVHNSKLITENDIFFGSNHSHWFSELVFVLEGSIRYVVEEEEVILHETEGIFIRKDIMHAKDFFEGDRQALLVFHLDYYTEEKQDRVLPEYIKDEERLLTNLFYQKYKKLGKMDELMMELGCLAHYMHGGYVGNYIKMRSGIMHLIISACQSTYNMKKNPMHEEWVEKYQLENSVYVVGRYIQDHISERLSVEEVAKELHYTPRHLQRLMMGYYNTSFSKTVVVYRIAYVKKLLATTELKNEEISIMSGFGSVKVMQKHFKNTEGITLTQYRNEARNRRNRSDLQESGHNEQFLSDI